MTHKKKERNYLLCLRMRKCGRSLYWNLYMTGRNGLRKGEFDLEGIWTGFIWLQWPHARRMCFRIMREDATGLSEVARQCNSGFIAPRHSGLPAMAGDGL
ncbi:hypothetical protein TcCL_NonESM10556 [Trypanosoma cruzi]|nr:hypothetical protein TcCL_NonESM10556 [Trypanosoma cruzi]